MFVREVDETPLTHDGKAFDVKYYQTIHFQFHLKGHFRDQGNAQTGGNASVSASLLIASAGGGGGTVNLSGGTLFALSTANNGLLNQTGGSAVLSDVDGHAAVRFLAHLHGRPASRQLPWLSVPGLTRG